MQSLLFFVAVIQALLVYKKLLFTFDDVVIGLLILILPKYFFRAFIITSAKGRFSFCLSINCCEG